MCANKLDVNWWTKCFPNERWTSNIEEETELHKILHDLLQTMSLWHGKQSYEQLYLCGIAIRRPFMHLAVLSRHMANFILRVTSSTRQWKVKPISYKIKMRITKMSCLQEETPKLHKL